MAEPLRRLLASLWGALLLVASAGAWAQAANAPPPSAPAFETLGIDRRFQAEIITEVMQDRVGFLWIGTREGLYLYDGQRFRHFQHEVQDPDSISSNGVRGVFEDSRGRLWVHTINGGLNLLDRAAWRFTRWRHDAANPHSLAHDGVFALEEAGGGRLWVGTQAGLDLYDPASGRFERQVLATGGEFVMALHRDRAGRLWVGTLDQGLYRQNAEHDGFDPVPFPGGGEPLDVFALAQDARGRVWAGARDGLYRFDPRRGQLVAVDLGPNAPPQPLANFTELEADPQGGLWMGTFGHGLYRLDPDTEAARPVAIGPNTQGARHIDQGALQIGRDGSLFVGTFGAGLFRHRPGAVRLRQWRESREGQPGLTFADVYALLGNGPGHLLVDS